MNNGVAHFLEHMYFKGTPSRTAEELEIEYEMAGAQMNAHTAREYTCFTSHCLQNDIERSVDSLADVLLNSKISVKDIEAERKTILREQEEVNTNLEEVLFDEIHQACYQQSSLGHTILGSKKNIKNLTRDQMVEYRDTFYTAPNMILVGVGEVDHTKLTNLAKKFFSKLPSKQVTLKSEPKYIGTEVKLFDKNIPLLYQAIGFEGPSLHSADMLSVNVLQILLGSWDISTGGGKHIHSSLCTMVAENGWARSISSFNHSYSDTGLFGVQMVSDGEDVPTESLNIEVVAHMAKFCYKIEEFDLQRAKNILKNQILSQYEGRLDDVCEEIGKQILFFGRRPSVAEMFARIDTITTDQVMAVAQKYIFDQDPFICSIGKALWALDYNMLRNQTYQWKH